MTTHVRLFSNPEIAANARLFMGRLERYKIDARKDDIRAERLQRLLAYILRDAEGFDALCRSSIRQWGNNVAKALDGASESTMRLVDELSVILYLFVVEYDISQLDHLPSELSQFESFVTSNVDSFSSELRPTISLARQQVPIQVLKRLLADEAFGSIQNVAEYSGKVDAVVRDWSDKLSGQIAEATKLKGALTEYTTAFNFVGLHQGFDRLSIVKKKELLWLRLAMLFFGVALVGILGTELYTAVLNRGLMSTLEPSVVGATAVISVSLTLVFVYFFRLAVRSADMCKAQLLQIELRKTLCEFIQNYTPFAKEMKASNPDSLAKFESVIFSGLVSSDEKLPSTFDGMDQIANLVKSLQSPKDGKS